MNLTALRRHSLLAGILLIALALRFGYLWQISSFPDFAQPPGGSDSAINHEIALRIASGDLLLGNDVYYFSSPLYKYFLGGLYALFGGSFWTARMANIVLGTGVVLLIYFLSLRLFREKSVALLSAFGAALYGPFVVFDTSMLKTSLELFLLSLSLLLLSAAFDSWSKRYFRASGLALGLTYALHPQVAVFVIFVCLFILAGPAGLVLSEGRRTYLKTLPERSMRAGLILSGVVLALSPFVARNYFVAKDLVLGGTGDGIHFHIGNHKGAWGGYSPVEGIRQNAAGHFHDARRIAEADSGRSLSAPEVSRYWRARTLSYISRERADFLRLIAGKIRLFFSFYEVRDNGDYQYLRSRIALLRLLPDISMLLPLGMAGLLMSAREFRKYWLLHIFFAASAAAVIVTFVTWRYRLPAGLVLWPAAAYLVTSLKEWMADRKLMLISAALSFVIYFIFLGFSHPVRQIRQEKDMAASDLAMEASRKEGELRRALESTSGADMSGKSGLWLKLALLRYELADTEGAVGILRHALTDDPGNAELADVLRLMLEHPVNIRKQDRLD